jgi:hypothetical protein
MNQRREGKGMTLLDNIIQLTDQLSLREKASLIEYISASIKRDVESEGFQRLPWHEFLERTAGILADDPMEIPEELPYEEREPLE